MPEAIAHFAEEVAEKVHTNQARIVAWDNIKDNPPRELEISPIAAIPHKSKAFCLILELSFWLKLKNGGVLASVNDTMEKNSTKRGDWPDWGLLVTNNTCISETDETAKIFMAKWDIRDGFWCLDCTEGEEYNFAYVLPQLEEEPIQIVIPTSLQMGWVESPPYFCVAMEIARDVAKKYIKMPVTSLRNHMFVKYETFYQRQGVWGVAHYSYKNYGFLYMVEVYVDDLMSLVIPVLQEQLRHVAMAVMMGIHDMFPPDDNDSNNPISERKLIKMRDNTLPKKRYSALTSTAWQRQCGFNWQRGRSSLLFLRAGYEW
jgi:hypothetical protein